ncbi:MAG: hypothetical protein IH984_11550 [Planctomycetes bacterium]|nr:hypothetical protein [Planctomycetota bacterium]
MFSRLTSQDHSASKRKHKWTIGAWVMGILFLSAAAPALANDSASPKSGGYRQVQNIEHYHGNGNYRSRSQRQFERGMQAGLRDGRHDGYDDGMYGHGYHPKPAFGSRNRSRSFQKGYRRGYRRAYESAFHRGQHQRQHDRQHRRRRWIWSFDW